ncbi:MAG: hypothetical protein Q9160_003166 [Pyrenula sp. 1 TL-2023]
MARMTTLDKLLKELPIAELSPEIEDVATKCIEAVVTLVWPYSSSERTFSLLLAAHDFRLRSSKGQVRVNFRGSSAAELARTRIGIGDSLRLSLKGCKWGQNVQDVATPGKRVGWDLLYETVLEAEINPTTESSQRIEIDSSNVSRSGTPDVALAPRGQATTQDITQGTPMENMGTWSTPIFLRGKRVSSGPFADIVRNLFTEEDGYIPGKGRKRTKFARDSGSWRYMSRTPSPVKNGVDHDSSLGTEDEEVLEENRKSRDGSIGAVGNSSETTGLAVGTPEQMQLDQVHDTRDIHDGTADMAAGSPVVSTEHSLQLSGLSNMAPPPLRITEQNESSPNRSPKARTPRLEPLASPGLPLVSPLVKRSGYFPTSYFSPTTMGPSELDASAQIKGNFEQRGQSLSPVKFELPFEPEDKESAYRSESPNLQPETEAPESPLSPSLRALRGKSELQPGKDALAERSLDFYSPEAAQESVQELQLHTAESELLAPLHDHDTDQARSFVESDLSVDRQDLDQTADLSAIEPSFHRARSVPTRRKSYEYDGPSSEIDGPDVGINVDKRVDSPSIDHEETAPLPIFPEGSPSIPVSTNSMAQIGSNVLRQRNEESLEEDLAKSDSSTLLKERLSSPRETESPTGHQSRLLKTSFDDAEERTASIYSAPLPADRLNKEIADHAIDDSSALKPVIVEIEEEDSVYDSGQSARTSRDSNNESIQRHDKASEVYQADFEEQEEKNKAEDEGSDRRMIEEELEAIRQNDILDVGKEDLMVVEDEKPSDRRQELLETERDRANEKGNSELADEVTQEIPRLMTSKTESNLLTPNNTQEASQPSPVLGNDLDPTPGLITPDRSQNKAELPAMMDNEHSFDTTTPREPKPVQRRRASRNIQRPLDPDTPQVSSPWFTPRQPVQQKPTEQEQYAPIDKVSIKSDQNLTFTTPRPSDDAPKKHQKDRLTKGYRTLHAYFATLSSLPSYFNQTIDIIALSTSPSTPLKRAPSGPRDYYTTLHLTDPSMNEKNTTVQIFRPYKTALPSAGRGEVVLLRDFKVQSRKGAMELLSTESSGWVIFHETVKSKGKAKASVSKERVTVSGPPVDYGTEEFQRADELAIWWLEEGCDLFPEEPNGSTRVTRSTKKAESASPSQSESKDGVQQAEPQGKSRSSDSSNLGPALLHELRDGTKYYDPVPGSLSPTSHELRDGTKWFDVPRARGRSEPRPGSRG